MKNLLKAALLVASFAPFCSASNPMEQARASAYFKSYPTVYLSFPKAERMDLDYLNTILSLEGVKGDRVYAYASPKAFERFLKEGIEYQIEPMPGEDYDPSDVYDGDLDNFRAQSLLNYDKYIALINKYATENPSICKAYEVGKSGKGKSMMCLRLSSGLDTDDQPKRPRFLMTCAIHGNELNGTYLAYNLMDYLVKGYRSGDRQVRNYLDNLDIFIAPHMNPDGTFPNGNTMQGCRRENASGVDLNRSYPSPLGGGGGYSEGRAAVETKATMNFEKQWRMNFALDYHDDIQTIIYHWGCMKDKPHNVGWLKEVGNQYAQNCGFSVTQASEWYVAKGARMDWQPYFNHCWGFTVECENKGTKVTANWEKHKKGLLAYMDVAQTGITGTVSGADVDNVKVTLKQNGKVWDKNGSEAYARPDGYYIHYAPAGTWDVVFSKGSQTKTVSGVQVQMGQTQVVDVTLD